jgi:hopene-associated glycosyltransferase HpnB
LLIPSLISLAAWIYLIAFHARFWRVRDESVPVAAITPARVAAVIPARDEAATIARAVASLRNQDFGGEMRVFVVDDHSTDGTAEQAAAAEVITSAPLPAGWTGKMWAVSQGLKRALAWDPDWVLLTDADIEHASDNIRALLSRAERGRFDLASFMVRLRNHTAAERFAIPAFVFFFFKLYPPARGEGAAGGCMLVRASMLRRIGGVQRIRGEIIDDCALAREVKLEGGRIWLGLTSRTVSLRQYNSLGEIASMIARSAFTQLRHSRGLLIGTVIGMMLIYVVPPVGALTGNPFSAAAWLLMAISYAPMLRFYGQSLLWAPLLPAVAVFYTSATVWSAIRHFSGRGGLWKGRTHGSAEPPGE